MKQSANAISSVLETIKQETEAPIVAGVKTWIWTENMLAALENGVNGGKWFSLSKKNYPNAYFAELGLFTSHEA